MVLLSSGGAGIHAEMGVPGAAGTEENSRGKR